MLRISEGRNMEFADFEHFKNEGSQGAGLNDWTQTVSLSQRPNVPIFHLLFCLILENFAY